MIFQTDQTEPSLMFGGGPSWLPQNTRSNPFAQPNRQSGFRGLLGNQDLALALLANSGYSPQKRSFGEILGTSMLQANQMKTGREEADFKRKYMEAQMGAMQAKPTGPSSVQEYEYAKKNGFAGSFQDWIVAGGQSSRPSAVQEWEHFNSLSPKDQDRYLLMKRSQMQSVQDLAGGKSVVSASPLGNVSTTPLTSSQAEIDAAARRKEAEAQAGAVGAGAGGVFAEIQKKGANSKVVMDTLDIADSLIDAATGSLVGAGADKLAAVFGKAPDGAQAIASLKVLQAGLMLNMPRMEGPQSDRDVELYQQAAASLGDPTVPREIKKSAVTTIRQMQQKYADRASQPFQIHPGAAPAKPNDTGGWSITPAD